MSERGGWGAGAAAGVAVAVALLSGCQQSPGAGGAGPSAAPAAEAPAVPAASAGDRELLEWAEQVHTADCMRKAGFTYYVEWVRDTTAEDGRRSDFGSADTSWAQAYGYGIQRRPPKPSASPGAHRTNADYVGGLSPERRGAYTAALNGDRADSVTVPLADGNSAFTPRGGCTSAARRELYGDLDRWFALDIRASNLQLETGPLVAADARYTEALTAWRTCMAAAGHPAQSPGEARRQVASAAQELRAAGEKQSQESQGPDAAWQLEVSTATADARCSGSSQLVTVAERVAAEARGRIREQSRAEFAEYDALRARAVGRARELIEVSTRTTRVESQGEIRR
ncbi:hypothetical protein ACWCYY_12370 [Kitasatospora sp. NPDC001664]